MNKSEYNFLAHGHGKTAPWIDLVNSQEWDTFGRPTDHLNNPAWVAYFLRQWHLASPSREPAPIARLKTLRAVLRRGSEALFHGKPIPSPQLRALNGVLNLRGKQQLFSAKMGCGLNLCRTNVDGVRFRLRLLARSSKLSPMASRHASRSAATAIAAGFSMTKQKAKPAAGAAAKAAANRERVRRARARDNH